MNEKFHKLLDPTELYESAVKQDSSVTLNAFTSWLNGDETYTFHNLSRKKFEKSKVFGNNR